MCLVKSLGKWATDILGRFQMQLAHSHACSLSHIYTENLSLTKCFFFFFFSSSSSYLLTPVMDPAASAGVLSSLPYEKKDAKKSESLTWPSKLSEYLTRAVRPHAEPFNSFGSRQLRGQKEKQRVDSNGPDCMWLAQANAGQSTVQFYSACACVSYSKIPLWDEVESQWLPVQCRGKPRKATKCVPWVALVIVVSMWLLLICCGYKRFDGGVVLKCADGHDLCLALHSRCHLLGRTRKASPLLTTSNTNG